MRIYIEVGNFRNVIELSDDVVNEFKLKRDSLDIDCELEDFIVDDISTLVENEIDNGLYGLFNY
tara:strand:+ start:402 stop:593 length:192 start_codon:yes stop_codon:yes gene_type:complete